MASLACRVAHFHRPAPEGGLRPEGGCEGESLPRAPAGRLPRCRRELARPRAPSHAHAPCPQQCTGGRSHAVPTQRPGLTASLHVKCGRSLSENCKNIESRRQACGRPCGGGEGEPLGKGEGTSPRSLWKWQGKCTGVQGHPWSLGLSHDRAAAATSRLWDNEGRAPGSPPCGRSCWVAMHPTGAGVNSILLGSPLSWVLWNQRKRIRMSHDAGFISFYFPKGADDGAFTLPA